MEDNEKQANQRAWSLSVHGSVVFVYTPFFRGFCIQFLNYGGHPMKHCSHDGIKLLKQEILNKMTLGFENLQRIKDPISLEVD